MDGNGRWAKERGLPRIAGHQRGAQVLKEVIGFCLKRDVRYLTVYAFSSENWNRPLAEIKGLLGLLEHYLDTEEASFLKNDVRLKVIGERHRLPQSLQEGIARVEEKSGSNQKLCLQIAFSYGSRGEILQASRQIAQEVSEGRLKPEDVTQRLFERYLYTQGVPDPDLLIRTSGEQRISNFLLWQMAYTEFVFTSKYWPDFKEEDLEDAFAVYAKRERRFGLAS
jgi:undecaprenyl diphosphate synthase